MAASTTTQLAVGVVLHGCATQVMAEIEKLGAKYRVALRLAKVLILCCLLSNARSSAPVTSVVALAGSALPAPPLYTLRHIRGRLHFQPRFAGMAYLSARIRVAVQCMLHPQTLSQVACCLLLNLFTAPMLHRRHMRQGFAPASEKGGRSMLRGQLPLN